MDYEKRHKEALSFLKDLKPHMSDYCIEKLEGFFPELKESEDEKIRKDCIKYLNWEYQACSINEDKMKIEKCVSWLEKQGEQKPTVFTPKFHVGDKLVSTKNPRLTYEVLEVGHINELGNPEYEVEIFTDGKGYPRNIHYMECYKVDEWARLVEKEPTRWKPSKEQMRVLQTAIIDYGISHEKSILESLYNDLKNL